MERRQRRGRHRRNDQNIKYHNFNVIFAVKKLTKIFRTEINKKL